MKASARLIEEAGMNKNSDDDAWTDTDNLLRVTNIS